jgi:type II secretory pathway predicted ATPase ExeA
MERVLECYGLERMPFDRATRDLYASEGFQELMARLRYTVSNRLFFVLSGDVGAGKSSAIRALKDELDPSVYRLIYISDSNLAPRAFYEHALAGMGVSPPRGITRSKRLFRESLLNMVDQHKKEPVIVIDEAHNASHEMFQEMRFILSFNLDARSLFTLVLVGQSELKQTMKLLVYLPVMQRVDLTFHLGGLSSTETKGYIEHHLRIVGCDRPVFTQDVIDKIYAHSKGIPRVINKLALACLIDAGTRNDQLVEDLHLVRVLSDFEE